MTSWTRTSFVTLGCAGWLLLAGCQQAITPSEGPVRGEPEVPASRPEDDRCPSEPFPPAGPREETVAELRPDLELRALEGFVSLYQSSVPPYRIARQHVTRRVIPRLHEMLKDPEWSPCWPAIAFAIGEGSDDPSSVPVLLDYIRGSEEWDSYEEFPLRQRVSAKIGVIQWLGRIGGQQAVTALRAAITREGAADLVKDWGTDEHVLSVMGNNPAKVVRLVNEFAAVGLVFTQDPENIAVIEEERRKALNPARTMIDAAAYQRAIEEHGIEAVLAAKGTRAEMDLMTPVLKEIFEKNGMIERR